MDIHNQYIPAQAVMLAYMQGGMITKVGEIFVTTNLEYLEEYKDKLVEMGASSIQLFKYGCLTELVTSRNHLLTVMKEHETKVELKPIEPWIKMEE